MAGFYPTPPAPRIPYDLDGSVVTASGGAARRNSYNDPSRLSRGQIVVLFPLPYDLHACAMTRDRTGTSRLYVSTDTTNGIDGTWAQVATATSGGGTLRSEIISFESPHTGLAGVRTGSNADGASELALFGHPSDPPDGLQIWDPTSDEPRPTLLDFENIPRGEAVTLTFRVKNQSSDDASGITMSDSTPDESTPATAPMFTISTDGGSTFDEFPVALDDLNAGDISPVYHLRYSPPLNAALIPAAARWTIAVDTWT